MFFLSISNQLLTFIIDPSATIIILLLLLRTIRAVKSQNAEMKIEGVYYMKTMKTKGIFCGLAFIVFTYFEMIKLPSGVPSCQKLPCGVGIACKGEIDEGRGSQQILFLVIEMPRI